MTNKSFNDKWLDAQVHPEKYSDEELDELLFSTSGDTSDDNTLGDSEGMVLLKRAFAYDEANDTVDVEKEWKEFEEKYPKIEEKFPDGDGAQKMKFHFLMKIAAAFIGLLMLSGLSYAAYHIASQHTAKHPVVAETDSVKTSPTNREKTLASQDWVKIEPTKKAPVVFEDAELSTILKYIADKANVKVEYRNPAAAHVRFYLQWDKKDTLQDIIDKLNHFEKVHVAFDEANQLLIVE